MSQYHEVKCLLFSGNEVQYFEVFSLRYFQVPCDSPTFTVAWHPKLRLLAYACDDKDKYNRDAGTVKLFGLPSESSSSRQSSVA